MKAVHASSTAKVLTAMRMRVSLPRIERALKARISILLYGFACHKVRHGDHLRTDLQVSFRSGFQVNLQPDLVPFDKEGDHASRLREAFPLTDGQHFRSLQLSESLCHMFLIRRGDEKDLAAS